MKNCSKCNVSKPFLEFSKDKSRGDGYCHCCRTCKSLAAKQYNSTERGKEVNRKSVHKYARTENGRRVRREIVDRYQKTPRGRALKHAASIKATLKRYHQDPEYHKRKVWLRKHGLDDYRLDTKCAICNTADDLTLDHKHPVSRGGTSDDNNLWTLCRSCNSFKGVRLMTEGRAIMVGDTIRG